MARQRTFTARSQAAHSGLTLLSEAALESIEHDPVRPDFDHQPLINHQDRSTLNKWEGMLKMDAD
ncbi:hypothetical protein CTI14_01700 [Methylobacterium radiotolerans]|nr:hypothetical protein CTI14_01700 [Methylobacterium radiotolerans]